MEKVIHYPLTVNLSLKCNRFCSHCIGDADMNGALLTLGDAQLLSTELKRVKESVYEQHQAKVFFFFHFTGNGESLLNPDLPEIMDILFSDEAAKGSLVTSGIDSSEEKDLMEKLLARPYLHRLFFCLSFNLFQKNFPKRITKTLGLLFTKGVPRVTIKICQPNERAKETISQLDKILLDFFTPWVQEINPLASRFDTFYPIDIMLDFWEILESLWGISKDKENFGETIDERFSFYRPQLSKKELAIHRIVHETFFHQCWEMQTKFGPKQIVYSPHYMTKRGRARKLKQTGFPKNNHLKPCGYLAGDQNCPIKLAADGYYYPACGCPEKEALQIGHVSQNFRKITSLHAKLSQMMLREIIQNQSPYETICDHCIRVADSKNIFREARKRLS